VYKSVHSPFGWQGCINDYSIKLAHLVVPELHFLSFPTELFCYFLALFHFPAFRVFIEKIVEMLFLIRSETRTSGSCLRPTLRLYFFFWFLRLCPMLILFHFILVLVRILLVVDVEIGDHLRIWVLTQLLIVNLISVFSFLVKPVRSLEFYHSN